ncbi:TPA: SSXT protein (N-terminal region) [Trebouxia sp. C0005]
MAQVPQALSTEVPTREQIQQELEDNEKLIKAILENMNAGKLQACAGYQKKLQQNLMRLASIADAQPPPTVVEPSNAAAVVPQQQASLAPQQ